MIYAFIFIFGAIIGSFLNAVIYRSYIGESLIKKRSRCVHCQQTLKVKDLIPIFSWLFLKGRCAYCKKKISYQYPLVEFFTALIFLLGYLFILDNGNSFASQAIIEYAYFLIVSCFLILIFVFDYKYMLIPDLFSIPLIVIALIFNVLLNNDMAIYLLSAVIGFSWFGWQYFLSRGKWIGDGDLRLGFAMGLILGWPGIAISLWWAYILGGIIAITLLIMKRTKAKAQLPFGTFLVIATLITWLWGEWIWQWYINLVSL